MIIGTIKETKDGEGRVGLTPELVSELYHAGNKVLVQKGAGEGIGVNDLKYFLEGAEICDTAEDVAKRCDMLVKVKEPTPAEFHLLDLIKGKILITFLHLGANKALADKLCECNITGISYDTIENEYGDLYMLKPMSIIAGELAAEQIATCYKQKLTRAPEKVCVIGCGISGQSAFKQMASMFRRSSNSFSDLHIFDLNNEKLKELKHFLKDGDNMKINRRQKFTFWNRAISSDDLKNCDAVIGAVLIPGKKAPIIISKEQLRLLPRKAFLVDIAIDQGGCIEGVHPTTLNNMFYEEDNLLFSCVPNLPGSTPYKATYRLSMSTSQTIFSIAQNGIKQTCKTFAGFEAGINTQGGKVVNETVLRALNGK